MKRKNENNKENIPNLKNEDSKIDQNMGNNVESPRKAFLNEVIEEESKLSLSPEKQMIVPCNFNSLLSDKTGEDIKKECSTNLINKSKENLNNSSNIVLSESKSNKNESINSSFKEKASEVVNEGLKKSNKENIPILGIKEINHINIEENSAVTSPRKRVKFNEEPTVVNYGEKDQVIFFLSDGDNYNSKSRSCTPEIRNRRKKSIKSILKKARRDQSSRWKWRSFWEKDKEKWPYS